MRRRGGAARISAGEREGKSESIRLRRKRNLPVGKAFEKRKIRHTMGKRCLVRRPAAEELPVRRVPLLREFRLCVPARSAKALAIFKQRIKRMKERIAFSISAGIGGQNGVDLDTGDSAAPV